MLCSALYRIHNLFHPSFFPLTRVKIQQLTPCLQIYKYTADGYQIQQCRTTYHQVSEKLRKSHKHRRLATKYLYNYKIYAVIKYAYKRKYIWHKCRTANKMECARNNMSHIKLTT